jgi:hypothetical protein
VQVLDHEQQPAGARRCRQVGQQRILHRQLLPLGGNHFLPDDIETCGDVG